MYNYLEPTIFQNLVMDLKSVCSVLQNAITQNSDVLNVRVKASEFWVKQSSIDWEGANQGHGKSSSFSTKRQSSGFF